MKEVDIDFRTVMQLSNGLFAPVFSAQASQVCLSRIACVSPCQLRQMHTVRITEGVSDSNHISL